MGVQKEYFFQRILSHSPEYYDWKAPISYLYIYIFNLYYSFIPTLNILLFSYSLFFIVYNIKWLKMFLFFQENDKIHLVLITCAHICFLVWLQTHMTYCTIRFIKQNLFAYKIKIETPAVISRTREIKHCDVYMKYQNDS